MGGVRRGLTTASGRETVGLLAALIIATSSIQKQLSFECMAGHIELRTQHSRLHTRIFVQADSSSATWDDSNAMDQANASQSPSKKAQGHSIIFKRTEHFEPLYARPARPTALHRRDTLFTTGSVAIPLNHHSKLLTMTQGDLPSPKGSRFSGSCGKKG